MKKRWMKNNEGWLKNDGGWKMNDEGWWFQAVEEGFCFKTDRQTNEWTDICNCRVAFAPENIQKYKIRPSSIFVIVEIFACQFSTYFL